MSVTDKQQRIQALRDDLSSLAFELEYGSNDRERTEAVAFSYLSANAPLLRHCASAIERLNDSELQSRGLNRVSRAKATYSDRLIDLAQSSSEKRGSGLVSGRQMTDDKVLPGSALDPLRDIVEIAQQEVVESAHPLAMHPVDEILSPQRARPSEEVIAAREPELHSFEDILHQDSFTAGELEPYLESHRAQVVPILLDSLAGHGRIRFDHDPNKHTVLGFLGQKELHTASWGPAILEQLQKQCSDEQSAYCLEYALYELGGRSPWQQRLVEWALELSERSDEARSHMVYPAWACLAKERQAGWSRDLFRGIVDRMKSEGEMIQMLEDLVSKTHLPFEKLLPHVLYLGERIDLEPWYASVVFAASQSSRFMDGLVQRLDRDEFTTLSKPLQDFRRACEDEAYCEALASRLQSDAARYLRGFASAPGPERAALASFLASRRVVWPAGYGQFSEGVPIDGLDPFGLTVVMRSGKVSTSRMLRELEPGLVAEALKLLMRFLPLPSETVEFCEEALCADTPQVQEAAANAIHACGFTEAVLSSMGSRTPRDAILQLARANPKMTTAAVSRLDSRSGLILTSLISATDDVSLRNASIRALGDLLEAEAGSGIEVRRAIALYSDEEALQMAAGDLFSASDDPDVAVRRSACTILAYLEHSQAMAALVARLEDASPEVVAVSARSLGTVGLVGAVPALSRVVETVSRAPQRPSVGDRPAVAEACIALGRIGDRRAAGILAQALSDEGSPASVRCAAAHALGLVGSSESVGGLLGAIAEDGASEVVQRAGGALASLGDSTALPGLIRLIDDELQQAHRRSAALHALGRLGGPAALKCLRRHVQESHELSQISSAIIAALGNCGTELEAELLIDHTLYGPHREQALAAFRDLENREKKADESTYAVTVRRAKVGQLQRYRLPRGYPPACGLCNLQLDFRKWSSQRRDYSPAAVSPDRWCISDLTLCRRCAIQEKLAGGIPFVARWIIRRAEDWLTDNGNMTHAQG